MTPAEVFNTLSPMCTHAQEISTEGLAPVAQISLQALLVIYHAHQCSHRLQIKDSGTMPTTRLNSIPPTLL